MKLKGLISDAKHIQDKNLYLVIEVDPDQYGDDNPHPYLLSGVKVRLIYFTKPDIAPNGRIYIYEINPFNMSKKITAEIVGEFLGGVELTGTPQKQIEVAEQLAASEYQSMENLIGTVQGFVKDRKRYNQYCEKVRKHDYYKPYFNSPE